ncbi:MAG: class I SAM-dependent methyltransferase [Ignavibacteria bacterium]|nr:class I SAM-dependent methyltransferase [Ignavibacteria bacterium]
MNPWQQIPSNEYEEHMSGPGVQQLQVLNEIFRKVVDQFSPSSLCVLGCTNGNGFEHMIGKEVERLVGVDINYKYLAECRAWFAEDLPSMELLCADLDMLELQGKSFDLIHAALIFEYVDFKKALEKLSNWLKSGGILSVVLQLPSESSQPVSETKFESIKKLSAVINLVDVKDFVYLAEKNGMKEIYSSYVPLQKGKKFFVGYFKKMEIFTINK